MPLGPSGIVGSGRWCFNSPAAVRWRVSPAAVRWRVSPAGRPAPRAGAGPLQAPPVDWWCTPPTLPG